MKSNRGITNIILLSFASFLTVSVIVTLVNLLAYISDDLKNDFPDFEPSTIRGYLLFNIFTCLGAISTPFLLRYTSPKWVIVFCSFLNIWHTFQYLFPNNIAYLFYSALSGTCFGLMWICLISLIIFNSRKDCLERNISLFLLIAESGRILGSLLALGSLQKKIDLTKRIVLISALGTAIFLGSIFIIFLQRPIFQPRQTATRMEILLSAVRILTSKDTWLYLGTCAYIGWVGTYLSRIYASKISATEAFRMYFAPDTVRMSAIHGVAMGAGECSAAGLYTILGRRIRRIGRCWIVIFAFFLTVIAILWIILNIPNKVNETEEIAMGAWVVIPGERAVIKSNIFVAFVCSFLLGFGDASFRMLLYAVVGDVFEREVMVMAGVCKVVEKVFDMLAHFLGLCDHMVNLGVHLGLLCVGTFCFIYAQLKPSYVSRGILVVYVDDKNLTRGERNTDDVLREEEEDKLGAKKLAKQIRRRENAVGEGL